MSFGRVVIAGCHGRMGDMLIRHLEANGVETAGVDLPFTPENLCSACTGAKIAILCVPASAIKGVTAALAPYLPPDAILADIASVKVHPLRDMLVSWSGPVVGTHPLFGPSPDKEKAAVALVPGRKDEAADLIEALLTTLGWHVFRTTAQEHDEAVAKIQELNFLAGIAYFGLLAEDQSLLPFLTPSFRRKFAAARRLLVDDGPLFTGLFTENPYSQPVLQRFRETLELRSAGEVARLTEKVRWWDEQLSKEGRENDAVQPVR